MTKFKITGERTPGKHYLVPVEPVEGLETEYQGETDVPKGTYIERCECHPESTSTRYVEVIDGKWFDVEIQNFKII